MSRKYTITANGLAVTQAACIFQIPVSASQVIKVKHICIGQTSDAGDANAAMLRGVLARMTGVVTNGSGGASVTPRPTDTSWGAFTGTVRAGDVTTLPTTAGTQVILIDEPWNVQADWYYTPPPELEIEFLPSETIQIYVADAGEDFANSGPDAIANSITVTATCVIEVWGAL